MSFLTFPGREVRLQPEDLPSGAVSGSQGGPRPMPMSSAGKVDGHPSFPEVREDWRPQECVQSVVREPAEEGGGLV